jgi:hypothetical protein
VTTVIPGTWNRDRSSPLPVAAAVLFAAAVLAAIVAGMLHSPGTSGHPASVRTVVDKHPAVSR